MHDLQFQTFALKRNGVRPSSAGCDLAVRLQERGKITSQT